MPKLGSLAAEIETEVYIHRVVLRLQTTVPRAFPAVARAAMARSAPMGRATLAFAIRR
jgi:hypothetical protein